MNWECNIKKVQNGFILTRLDQEDMEDTVENKDYVFEYKEDITEDHDLEAVQRMLYELLEYFAIFYSKHNKKNIKIEIEENNGKLYNLS
jgi:hypothetical protein